MSLADLTLPPIIFKKAAHYTEGRTAKVRAFVNHRMVGTLKGTDSYFTNPDTRPVSTHFGVGRIDGKVAIHQYVPLDDTAYGNGNYDATGNWDNWGYPTTEINAQTISIEHQDHWGNDALKGIVIAEVQEASQKLQALLRYGTQAQWKAAGIRVRDWDTNGPILAKELHAIPVDGQHIVTHHDIAGKLKPYCWLPWAKDVVGFPRTKYVTQIRYWGNILQNGFPIVVPPVEPVPPETVSKAEYDTLKASYDALNAEVSALNTANLALKATILQKQNVINRVITIVDQAKALLNG